ncbi:MAG: 30S ribosomal protein S6 [Saprospiraceae bacterium]|nr:30S ribosomal protein S6 [Saprospiraceae bacterium]
MRHYEVTFIVDPVLSGDEIKSTAQTYVDMLQQEGCTIVHKDEMGLRQLAYPIKKRNSGVYFCVEFQSEGGAFIPKVELALSRDERIMRYLTVALDKFGVKFNDDKRKGLIGKKTRKAVAAVEGEGVRTQPAPAPAPAPVAVAPSPEPAPAPAAEEE